MKTPPSKLRRPKSNSRPTRRRKVYWIWSKKPDPAILADVVRCIVRVAEPETILLFGSAARGTMGPDSDYDLLVIKSGRYDRGRVTTLIHRELSGEAAVDAIVVTPEEVERYRDTPCLVICPALREGKVVYEKETVSAGRSA